MTAKMFNSLQQSIGDWIENNCDDEDRPDGYIHDKLSMQMSQAAAAVWDATFDGQKFAKDA